MQTSKRIAYVLLLIAFFAALNTALTYALVPYGSKSEIVWHDYHNQKTIDTIAIGDSRGQQGINPFILDEELETNCVNMCSPSQSCEVTYVALKEALSQHDVKTVYYCVNFDMFTGQSTSGPHVPYLREKWKSDSLPIIVSDFLTVTRKKEWIDKPESINWLFPWVNNHVSYDPAVILDNIRMRLDGTPVETAAEAHENGWKYKGKGFGTYDRIADFNTSHKHYSSILGKAKQASPEKLKFLKRICSLCEEKGVRLVVLVMPLPTYNLCGIASNYASFSTSLKSCVVENGGEYYDFNLAKPELFDNENDLYKDFEHFNTAGADAFTKALAQLDSYIEEGVDIDTFFYTYKERLEAIDTVQCVDIGVAVGSESVRLKATPFYGTKPLQVEYRFVYKRNGDKEWTEIRGYASESTCTFVPEMKGTYTFRVYARTVGATVGEYDCYYQKTATIQ